MSSWRRSGSAVRLLAVLCVTAGCAAAPQMSQGRVTPLRRYFELIDRIGRLEPRVDDIDARLESGISALNGTVALLDSRLVVLFSALVARMNAMVTKMDNLETQLAALTDSSQSERSRLDGAVTETASQQTQIAELTARLDRVEEMTKPRPHPRDCSELPVWSTTGIYYISPGIGRSQPSVRVFCDMETDGGKWTVFQRRDDTKPRQDFNLGWDNYKQGFGELTGEFWWGLNYLWQMTSVQDRRYQLRIDLGYSDGSKGYVVYQGFRISPEEDGFRLSISNYTGDAGDSLRVSVDSMFTTTDRDQDDWHDGNCADRHKGGWWYGGSSFYCSVNSNLNGGYTKERASGRIGIMWWTWNSTDFMKKTEMKIRPMI